MKNNVVVLQKSTCGCRTIRAWTDDKHTQEIVEEILCEEHKERAIDHFALIGREYPIQKKKKK